MNKRIFSLLSCLSAAFANAPHWEAIIEGIQGDMQQFQMSSIRKGASNINYRLDLDDSAYFVRISPKHTVELYSDLAIEYLALQSISDLGISPKPLYYDPNHRILVAQWIDEVEEEIDLLDPATRREVLTFLRKIEEEQIAIDRIYRPYEDVIRLVDKAETIGAPLLQQFLARLPQLKRIDEALSKVQKRSLCHLDLHHRNLIRGADRLWIVDWEYATMSHPFLVLASMASIERWDDDQMYTLLADYTPLPTLEERELLFLYRIAIDMFWTAWNHIQMHCSPINSPYQHWRDLFFSAAEHRLQKLFGE